MTTTSAPAPTAERRTSPVPGGLPAAVLGAVALAVCNALVAFTPGMADATDTGELVRVAREQTALVELGNALGLLSALLLVPGVWAVASRLAARTPRLAGAGGWTMGSGYVCFLVLPIETMIVVSVARAGGDASGFVAGMDEHTPATLLATYVVFGLGALVGTLVLGVAALRQRDAVPAWAGWALVASPVVRMGGLALGVAVGPALASLLVAAAFVGVWRGRR